jgi:hypothetical protein
MWSGMALDLYSFTAFKSPLYEVSSSPPPSVKETCDFSFIILYILFSMVALLMAVEGTLEDV